MYPTTGSRLQHRVSSGSHASSVTLVSSEPHEKSKNVALSSASANVIDDTRALSPRRRFKLVNLREIGQFVQRSSKDIATWMRLTSIRSKSTFSGSVWDDLLKFSGHHTYSPSIRRRALQILFTAIETQPLEYIYNDDESFSLVSRVTSLPQVEIERFVSDMVACISDDQMDYTSPMYDVWSTYRLASSRKRQITMRFAYILGKMTSKTIVTNAIAPSCCINLVDSFDRVVFKPVQVPLNLDHYHDLYPYLCRDDSHFLKLVAYGGPMWAAMGNFLTQCSVEDAQRIWLKMTSAVIYSSKWAFLDYEAAVRKYRDASPTLFFLEFCEGYCPISISSFCGAGLHSFLLNILANFFPGLDLPSIEIHKSNFRQRQAKLIETTSHLIDCIEQDGYGDIEQEQQYIYSIVFIALLALSLINDNKDGNLMKLRYQACLRRILMTARDRNVETWAAYVSYRTISGADTAQDPNILLTCFRIVEKVYDSEVKASVCDDSLESFHHMLEDLCEKQALYESYSLEYYLHQFLLVCSYTNI